MVRPLLGIFHYLLPACGVVVVHADFFADILLGYTEFLLHAQFNRQSVCIPTCLALHLVALHCFVAAERILDSTRQHVVNTRHAVCRRRSLEEQERSMPLADGYTLMEQVFLLPLLQYLAADSSQIQLFVLVKMLHSILLFFISI